MIISIKNNSSETELDNLKNHISQYGLDYKTVDGTDKTVWCLIGETYKVDMDCLRSFSCVADVKRISEPYVLASKHSVESPTVVSVGDVQIGSGLTFIAGPCSVESEEQIYRIAHAVKSAGASILRGGAYKPRSSPYSFQGLHEEGIKLLTQAGKEAGIPVITEITEISQLSFFADVDILQVGARNMQNYELLKELGQSGKPILLKRGLSATSTDLLMSAEYLMSHGNNRIILCERGIRTFEDSTRNTLDLSIIPVLKGKTHLPIGADPSHGTGRSELVEPMTYAAVSAGADLIMLEVDDIAQGALCDGQQAIGTDVFARIVKNSGLIKNIIR